MKLDHNLIKELVTRPTETLNIELKRWISPDDPAGIYRVVRAALALRNRNGGYLVIGFDDKTLLPDVTNEPSDIRATFHVDKIQGLVSRFASELFEIGIGFGERDGREYPVIAVPEGVRTPVAAKSGLFDSSGKC